MRVIAYKKETKILGDPQHFKNFLEQIIDASDYIILREMKKQVPVNYKDLRRSITVRKLEKTGVEIGPDLNTLGGESKYPIYLHEGTGQLEGARDYGYTTGRVRAGKVAKGIGGIRPNKFADRAYKAKEKTARQYIQKGINSYIKQNG